MSSDYARIKALYLAAADLDADERLAFLDNECGPEGALRKQVESLLGYADDPRSLEVVPTTSGEAASLPAEIGGYRIVRLIGQGGMGVVYQAEQDSPRRNVALKVLRAGLDGDKARRRFQLEAELLGRLRHPGIAQIHEAGSGAPGTPDFIVMEFVEGRTITEHARAENLDDDERLRILALVADAIQHAHSQGLVHRDIKPGNVLVDADGMPKVLDFGVARVLDDELRSKTLQTHSGEVIGTVSYMSPEQASGDPDQVDARSDVYALGVLGYELLTGELPHDLRGKWLHEAVIIIRDDPPVRPRERKATLPDDVETILLKALEKEKRRRYQTADAFAEDVRRFLRREPIAAHPPSSVYQLRMFARRHRYLVGSTVALVIVLAAGLWGTIRYAIRADDATARAMREKERAERTGLAIRMRAIGAAIEAGRTDEARDLLDHILPSRRGWEWHHFHARLDNSELLLGEDEPLVPSVGFRADDEALAVMTREGRLDYHSPETFAVVERSDFGPDVAAFALAGDAVVLARRGSGIELWRDGVLVSRSALEISAEEPVGIEVDDDGARCSVLSGDRAHVVDLTDGTSFPVGTSQHCAIAGDGSVVANGQTKLLDTRTGVVMGRFERDVRKVHSSAFSPSGRLVAFGTQGPVVYVVDAATMELVNTVHGGHVPISAMRWTLDGQEILTGDEHGRIKIRNIADGTFRGSLSGHDGAVAQLALSPSGEIAAAVTRCGLVRVWRLDQLDGVTVEAGHDDELAACAFSPDDSLLATVDATGSLNFWDGLSNTPVTSFERMPTNCRGLGWSPDGRRILMSRRRGTLEFDVLSGERLRNLKVADSAASVAWPGRLFRGRGVSASGALHFRSGIVQRPLSVLRSDNGDRVALIENADRIFEAVFSRDGRWVAVAHSDGRVTLHDGTTFELRHVLFGHDGAAVALAFSPDGSRLASGGHDQTVRLWDLEDRTEAAVLEGHLGSIRALTFSLDGTRLVSGSTDGTFRIWTTVPRRELVRRGLARDRMVREKAKSMSSDDIARAWSESGDPDVLRIGLEWGVGRKRDQFERIEGERGSSFGASLARVEGLVGKHFAVGAPLSGRGRGAIELVSATGDRKWTTVGELEGDGFGAAVVAISDCDGDGVSDVVAAAPGRTGRAGRQCGAIVVLSGADGRKIWQHEGDTASGRLGEVMTTASDHDGDGVAEIIAYGRSSPMRVAVISIGRREILRTWTVEDGGNPPLLSVPDLDGDDRPDFAIVRGQRVEWRSSSSNAIVDVVDVVNLGRRPSRTMSIAMIEDRDGDGMPEIAYSFQGTRSASKVTLRLSDSGETGWSVKPWGTSTPHLGRRVRPIGDLDDDGVRDVVIWSSVRRFREPQHRPTLTFISGSTGRILAEVHPPADSRALYGVSFAIDDVDGDGRLDALVASPDSDPPRIDVVPLAIPAPSRTR